MRTANLKNNPSAHSESAREDEGSLVKGNSCLMDRPAITSVGDLEPEEVGLAETGLVRLPTESLPDSFWEMPAPQVSFADAVAAVTSERDEDRYHR
jgi:hypothetical protein